MRPAGEGPAAPGALLALPLLSASFALAAEPVVLIRAADDTPAVWRFATETPPGDWAKPGFDDTRWREGRAGFGVADAVTPASTVGTPWTTSDIWLRKDLDVAGPVGFRTAALRIRHDEDAEVYLNGALVLEIAGYNAKMTAYDVTRELKPLLRRGRNCVAVHVRQTTGGQYIDLALVLDPGEKPSPRIERTGPAMLRRLLESRWTPERAREWYDGAGVIRGVNYLPRTAVNTTEMWQAGTFDPATIDQELGWAARAGYNGVRVFLQYLVWKDDAEGLKRRLERFLSIADSRGIGTMLVLFCDCSFAGKEPYLGAQDGPVPGVHNSGWVPSPGMGRVTDRSAWPDLERYVKDVVGAFATDERVLIWDLYNEPGNSRMGEKSLPLVEAAFAWAREARPRQPLTTGAWSSFDGRMSRRIMEISDVVSFHGYDGARGVEKKIRQCLSWGRPVLCTEWLHRQSGNTFKGILPLFAEHRVGWYHWGLVAGRTQTYMPWGSKRGAPTPDVWQHDVFHPDGTPYDPAEMEMVAGFGFRE